MHGLTVLTTLNQLQNSCFYGWKMWAYSEKRSRKALLRRCLRCLNVAVQKRKNLQKMALSALGF